MKSPDAGFETVRSGAVASTGYEPFVEVFDDAVAVDAARLDLVGRARREAPRP